MSFKWIDRPAAVRKVAVDGLKHGYTAEEAVKIFLIAPSGRFVKRADEISDRQLKRFITDVENELADRRAGKALEEGGRRTGVHCISGDS